MLNAHCVRFYLHCEVMLHMSKSHTQVESVSILYKCSKHCTVVGAQLLVDDHWLLLGSWL